MPFTFIPQTLKEVILVKPRIFQDARGFFMESYKQSEFCQNGIPHAFLQDNHSFSNGPVVRGLHFQMPPQAQGKLIRVTEGTIWDVVVDIRPQSPTFLQWLANDLNEENMHMLWIPPGFAHGFAALSDQVHMVYKCTAEYNADLNAGIRWNDPQLNIPWPIDSPILSEKDLLWPFIKTAKLEKISWPQ